jgi:T5SS/PEP-CTERM-associated repeat protein
VVQTLTLGSDGDGALTIASGGALIVEGDFDMAENAGSTSTATIGDAGATLTIHGEWQIGVAGTANATITQGVTAEALGGVTLGVQATVTGDIVIGEAGAGTANVQDGAVVDAEASDVTVGEEDTATGAATITGAGSQFETGSLTVGAASSKASVTVSSGGDLEIASDLTLGEQAGSKGRLKVSDAGSQVSVGGDATLGVDGSGTLTMTGGALSVKGAMTLGENKGSSGQLTLSDATMSITGDLKIGEAGSGTAIVQLASVLKSKAIELGGALGAKGSLTISGAGTSVTTGETTIGAGGTGTLKVNSGGLLTTNGAATIGSVAIGAIVSASLNTGGQWLVGGELDVGDSGAGTLSIAGKGTLVTADGDMTIGGAAGGTVMLGSTTASSSAQLKWENLLTVGEGAQGTLTINAGDKVSALAGGAGQVAIGADAGSSGTVSLAGTGASLKRTALFVGGTATKAGGSGSLSIFSGATTTFADATIWATGKVTDAGALSISGPLSGSGSVQISGAGQFTLGGSDSTAGIDFVAGGSNERLDLSAAHLPSVHIKGFGAHETIDVSGLSTGDTIGVSYKGSVATVRFLQAGKTVGKLLFAMKAGQGAFHFDAADGALTLTPKAAAETLLSASELDGQVSAYALPLDVLFASSAGVAYPTSAALDPLSSGRILAGYYTRALIGAHAFP